MTETAILVMEEARRQLVGQEAALDKVRAGVATLLTGLSIVAAVFGSALAGQRSATSWAFYGAAVAVFAVAVGVAGFVLWPHDWATEHDLSGWLAMLNAGDAPSPEDTALNFAEYFEGFVVKNIPRLETLQFALSCLCVLVGVELLLWAAAAFTA